MSDEPKLKWEGWHCPKCGDHYFTHNIHQGRPVCPEPPKAWLEAKEEIDAGWPEEIK